MCINWQLVDAPLSALEYVVAHEIVHLLHRNHGDAFWEALSCVMSRLEGGAMRKCEIGFYISITRAYSQ
ncbi:hypothetical protein CDG79_28625 [Nostoc sp. 'Peltigera membranacea cyanobiont' 232]|nr:hypothetical protein CDG79_28625 [Nostoc sp. 'Peltigera membranacea cyanobiont' 232]